MNTMKKISVLVLMASVVSVAAFAQVPGSALEYMLQKPRVSKYYTEKRVFDHLFVDAGLGTNVLYLNDPRFDGFVEFNVGDWLSPEHGVRLHSQSGRLKSDDRRTKYFGVGLDYLFNITALSRYGARYAPSRFELYGVAGIGYNYSHNGGVDEHGVDVHVGLRGQMALSSFTYVYAEPRISIMDDDVPQSPSWHGYRPVASVSAGLGYRLPDTRSHAVGNRSHGGWTDGLFLGIMGGPTMLLNSNPSSWGHDAGLRLAGSVGKWFGQTHGVRLTVNGSYFRQRYYDRVKAVGAQMDYLLNLHNAFGGYNPDRWFWLNAVAGFSYNYSSVCSGSGHKTFGGGGGLQANVRLSRNVNFVLEPRLDLYGQYYAPQRTSFSNHDVMGSILGGVVYTWNTRKALPERAKSFEAGPWYDHIFVEAGFGANVPVFTSAVRHVGNYARPSLYMAVGKWFTPLHGVRLWSQVAQTQYDADRDGRYKHVEVGADYVFNFTNALYGYRPGRRTEFTGALGANLARRQQDTRLYLGLDASLRGTWYPGGMVGLFIEPRLQGYGGSFLPAGNSYVGADLIASVHAGVQFLINASAGSPGTARDDGEGRHSSVMLSAGLTNHLGSLGTARAYSPVGRLSYTRWYSPVAAWRVSGQGYVQRVHSYGRVSQMGLGVDWMTDLTALAYGYDASRLLSVSALAGAGAGVDFGANRTCFAPDIHVGGQLSLRLTDALHLALEPQLSYQFSSRWESPSKSIMPQLLAGIEYSMPRRRARSAGKPERRHVIMGGIGAGIYSGAYREASAGAGRLALNADIGYGRWFSHSGGAYVRLGNLTARRRDDHNQNITSLQAGYMMDVKSAVTGEPADAGAIRLTALMGASLNMASRKGHSVRYAPGLQAAVQAGVMVTPQVELFVEPAAGIIGRTIESDNKTYNVEATAKLSIGTKIHF